jgi:ATP-dependent DNA helicase DinG
LPRAVLRFKQGVGRLIRSAEDSGRIVVLDPRIVTKFYGKRFMGALPEGVEPELV